MVDKKDLKKGAVLFTKKGERVTVDEWSERLIWTKQVGLPYRHEDLEKKK